MYASDYPHEVVVPVSRDGDGLGYSADLKQKLFWDNPLRYRRYGA
jgi:hypothetical protein